MLDDIIKFHDIIYFKFEFQLPSFNYLIKKGTETIARPKSNVFTGQL